MAFQEHTNENHAYIPVDATFAARIDGRKLIKTSISSILLNEDEEIIELLIEAFKDEHDTELKSVGISLNSDVILFNQTDQGHRLIGLLFNLDSPKVFKKNIKFFMGENHVSASNEGVGLVYFELDNAETKGLSKKYLQKKADKLLLTKSKFNFKLLEGKNENSIAQTWSKDGLLGDVNVAHNTKLSFIVNEKELIIDGYIAMNKDANSNFSKDIKPKGLHVSTDQIASIVNDSLTSFFSKLKIPEAQISSFSLNYYGLELITEPRLFPAPKFDALISFKNDFALEVVLDSMLNSEYSTRIDKRTISYYGLVIHYDLINSKTLYVGTSDEVEYIEHDSKTSFLVTGSPSYITKVEGGGIMKNIFEMVPIYTISREFLGRMDALEIRIDSPKNGKSKVHAVIQFKKNEYALNSVLKLLIQAK